MGGKTSGVLYTVGSQETTVGLGVERTVGLDYFSAHVHLQQAPAIKG